MWDLTGPGVEPVSPVLAERFLTIGPPGKSRNFLLISGLHAVLFLPNVHQIYIYIIGSQICLSFLASQLALKLLPLGWGWSCARLRGCCGWSGAFLNFLQWCCLLILCSYLKVSCQEVPVDVEFSYCKGRSRHDVTFLIQQVPFSPAPSRSQNRAHSAKEA